MIKCALFEFTRENGRGYISEEIKEDRRTWAAFQARADDLRQHGVGSDETRNSCPHIRDGIYKFKVKLKPQLRPHLCRGPEDMNGEATFLVFATEENSKLDPQDTVEIAIQRREILRNNPERKKSI